MSFKTFTPRVKQYEAANPSKARETVVQIVDTRTVLVMPIEKMRAVRSESYRRFVASHPCFGCGVEGFSQAAHPNEGKGLSLKTSDLLCFPLCGPHFGLIGCHAQLDQRIDIGRDEAREQERAYVARMQALARAAGRLEFA